MRRPRALTICVENPSVIPGRIEIEDIVRTVHPGGIFREKVILSEIYVTFFSAFAGIPENFCSICPQLSVPDYFREVKAIMPKMADSRLVTLPHRF